MSSPGPGEILGNTSCPGGTIGRSALCVIVICQHAIVTKKDLVASRLIILFLVYDTIDREARLLRGLSLWPTDTHSEGDECALRKSQKLRDFDWTVAYAADHYAAESQRFGG